MLTGRQGKRFFFEKKKQKTFAPLSRALLVGGVLLLGGEAVAQRAPTPHKPSPFDMAVVPWSLTPTMGSTELRLGLRAERQDSDPAPGAEQVIVFGRRLRKAPIESDLVRHDDAGAEAWQSEAAQPVVPGIGDSCSYKSGCFDKDQPGLFSTIPSLFGDH